MAEKTKKPGFFSRYIGGLLGEDAESMTQDDRRRATLSLLGSFGRNYLSAGSGDESLAAMRASRAAERKAVDDARRTAAAQAIMPDVASRIFGGTGGRSIEALPGAGGEAMPMTSRRVPTREGAREALGMLYGTQEGRDAATMAPGLVDVAKEGVTGRIVGGSVYDTMTGRFDTPRKAGSTTLTPAEVRQLGAPAGTIIQRDADGKLSVLSVPRAVGGGGGGMALRPGDAPGPGTGRLTNILTPDELRAANLPTGTVAQFNPKTGQVNVLSSATASREVTLTADDRKFIRETNAIIDASADSISGLNLALDLSKRAYEGLGASALATAASAIPGSQPNAEATIEFDVVIKQQVLPQLRIIFGANPTEGERAILEDLQGSSSQPRVVRDRILLRAIKAANDREARSREDVNNMLSGTYYKPLPPAAPGVQTSSAPKVDFAFQNGRIVPVKK